MRPTRILAIVAMLCATPLAGCGYALAGRGSFLPDYIKTIGVPDFVNNTPVFEVERRLTDKVRSELAGRGRYTMLPRRDNVDAVLLGEIQSITPTPVSFNQQQQVTRIALTVVVKVEFRDMKTDKVLWNNPGWQFAEQFDVTSATTGLDANAFLGQDQNALERLSSEFARALVTALLTTF